MFQIFETWGVLEMSSHGEMSLKQRGELSTPQAPALVLIFETMFLYVIAHPGSTHHSPSFCFPLLLSPPHSIPLHPHSLPSQHPPPPCAPLLPALNSVDGMQRTLIVFSRATRPCWPLLMRKWFRTWTRMNSRDSPLSTRSSQELLLPPMPLSRLDLSSCMDTWTRTHKHKHTPLWTLDDTFTLRMFVLSLRSLNRFTAML